MRTPFFAALLLTGWFAFAGCADRPPDATAIRVAALTYAFEHDPEIKADPAQWIFAVECDAAQPEVIRSLARFPLAQGKVQIEERGTSARVDALSGKRYVYWSAKVVKNEPGETWVDVGCVKGGLNGYGQMLRLEKKWWGWAVVASTHSWVSGAAETGRENKRPHRSGFANRRAGRMTRA